MLSCPELFTGVQTIMQGCGIAISTFRTPKPLGHDAPATVFSEARAMDTVKALSEDIGIRLVRACIIYQLVGTSAEVNPGTEMHRPPLACNVWSMYMRASSS